MMETDLKVKLNIKGIKYDKIKLIGKGAFGMAYLCKNEDRLRCVVKEVYVGHISKEEIRVTEKEAKFLSCFDHPNVIKYFDHAVKDSKMYIVMEHAPGGDLSHFIEEFPRPKEGFVYHLLAQLVTGLAYIHSLDIIHRDICSRNVLIGNGMILKLSDFGVSKKLGSTSGNVVGNPVNFAPELCWGQKNTKATDVWALGCLLHEIVTGILPFNSPSLAGLVALIVTSGPLPLAGYSKDLEQLFQSLMVKTPEDRPTAEELMAHPHLVIPLFEVGLPLKVTPLDIRNYFMDVIEALILP